jgi:quercetin dioxygenase-like cupin family protein
MRDSHRTASVRYTKSTDTWIARSRTGRGASTPRPHRAAPVRRDDGESVEMEFVLPSDCVTPPAHIDPQHVEEYEVLEGRFDVVIDGAWRTLARGESATVPVAALRTFKNHSGGVVRVRKGHRPAIRCEKFIERTLQAAGIKRKRDPRLFYISRW